MPIEEKLALAGRFLKAAAALVSLAVPTAALVQLQNLPHWVSRIAYFILPLMSLALILAIFIRGTQIGRLGTGKAASCILAFAITGAVLTVGYALIADKLLIERNTQVGKEVRTEIDIRPLFPTSQIQNLVGEEGDYHDALEEDKSLALKVAMEEERIPAIVVMLVMLVLAQLSFVAAIVGGAWWLAERNVATGGGQERGDREAG